MSTTGYIGDRVSVAVVPPLTHLKILFVGPDYVGGQNPVEWMEALGGEVFVADTATEATRFLNVIEFDLLVVNVEFAGADVIRFARESKQHRLTPVVAVGSTISNEDFVSLVELDVSGWMFARPGAISRRKYEAMLARAVGCAKPHRPHYRSAA